MNIIKFWKCVLSTKTEQTLDNSQNFPFAEKKTLMIVHAKDIKNVLNIKRFKCFNTTTCNINIPILM